MPSELSPESWAQIRQDYEHTERPVADICAEYGISSGTLRDRMRRWHWTRRRPPIPEQGPAAAPVPWIEQPRAFATPAPTPTLPVSGGGRSDAAPSSDIAASAAADVGTPDDIVPRLESAVARVLPAIEANLARLAAQPTHPREMERAARALASLTRTLRELNGLLSQRRTAAPTADPYDDLPADPDAFRNELARRIHAFVDSREREALGCAAREEV